MKMTDVDTNSPSSICRFAWLGVQVLDFTIYFLQLLQFLEYQFQLITLYVVFWHKYYKNSMKTSSSSQNDVKILIFPIPISFWSVLEIFKENRGDPEEIGMAGQSTER